jgi:hypothetical protein
MISWFLVGEQWTGAGDQSGIAQTHPFAKLLTAVPFHCGDQTAITSISGSMRFTMPSIPASVPEIELGQLPHAPW